MANIFDVARYFLEEHGPMSSMKLQKLCFYAQFWSYGWLQKPLFENDFRAWTSGPVNEELYHFIKKQAYDGAVVTSDMLTDKGTAALSVDEKMIADKILYDYGRKSAEELRRSSMMEYPWILVFGGPATGNLMTKESFLEAHQPLRKRHRCIPDIR